MEVEQHELFEHAQKRIRQKRHLYTHFVVFLIGSCFLLFINKVLKFGENHNWAVWVTLFWAFLLAFHFFNVFVTHKFMGKQWERKQREKLIEKQKQRIHALQKEIETEFPVSSINKKK